MARYLILDTSYLCELLRVPGKFDEEFSGMLLARMEDEAASDARFALPVQVLFETANFIAQLGGGAQRREIAGKFLDLVRSCQEHDAPFILLGEEIESGMTALTHMLSRLDRFVREFAPQQVSLTDVVLIEEARRLKKVHAKARVQVHIWTRDERLKSFEPDAESDPLL